MNDAGFITGISLQGDQIAVLSDCGNQCSEDHAYLASSTDGGGTFRFAQFENPASIYSADLSFVTPSHGWVAIGAASKPQDVDIFVTTDGGSHWRLESAVPESP